MTTYVTIPNTDIDQDSPITQPLMTALRDNPIAIAEADSSVAAGLLPTVHLGTLATTTGTSVSLTSLDLAPYRFLACSIENVSTSNNSSTITIDGQFMFSVDSLSNAYDGFIHLDLANGVFGGGAYSSGGGQKAIGGDTSYTTATTTVTFAVGVGGNFDSGSIRVYGVK